MQRCLPLFWTGSVLFPHFIVGRFFSFRSAFLSLGSGDNCVDSVRMVFGMQFSIGKERFFSCSFIKFVEGSYFIQFAYSISEYSYRGGVNHSFYVSVGGISSYDVLLSGKEIPLGDVCGLHVLVRSGLAFIGGTGGEKMVIRQSDWQQLVFLCFPMRGILLAYE